MAIFLVVILSLGGYSLLISALASIALILILWVRPGINRGAEYQKRKGLQCPKGIAFYGLCALSVFTVLSLFFAVDRGEALLGVIKFVPIPLFALAAAQMDNSEKRSFFDTIPWVGAAVTVLSAIAYLTPARDYFFTAGRLGGCFQYPNTFALFLLLALIVLCQRELGQKWDCWLFAVCSAGILLTGSRSVFILTAAFWLYAIITKKKSRKRIILLSLFILCLALLAGAASGNIQSFVRILSVGSSNSTFWGRLLYWYDSLELLKKFPLGMGYMGFYFVQGSFQSGNYAVMYAHNELLQCALDFGIPCGLLMAGITVHSFFSKNTDATQKLILLALSLHSLFDFDYQFLAMSLIYVLCLDPGETRLVKHRSAIGAFLAVLLCLQLYGALFSGLQAAGWKETAVKVYPGLTLTQMEQAQQSTKTQEREALADKVLSRNEYCAAVYKVKAEDAAAEGRFLDMEGYARRAISRDRYNPAVYEDYLKNCSIALDYYIRAGEEEKAAEFLRYAAAVDELMEQAEQSASPLAFKIKDKPTLELSDEYNTYLEEMNRLWEEIQ